MWTDGSFHGCVNSLSLGFPIDPSVAVQASSGASSPELRALRCCSGKGEEEDWSKMTTIRRFCCDDLLKFANVNIDHLTETFSMAFYQTYMARWPDYCHVADGPNGSIMGYIMGKVEGQGENWHGHVTAVTVAPEYRRQQLAKKLMNILEDITEKTYNGYFVDLFVRASNAPAITMYQKLGYSVYRRVLKYYSGEEDGLDMRKAMPRDVHKKSIIPLKRAVTPEELEYD